MNSKNLLFISLILGSLSIFANDQIDKISKMNMVCHTDRYDGYIMVIVRSDDQFRVKKRSDGTFCLQKSYAESSSKCEVSKGCLLIMAPGEIILIFNEDGDLERGLESGNQGMLGDPITTIEKGKSAKMMLLYCEELSDQDTSNLI